MAAEACDNRASNITVSKVAALFSPSTFPSRFASVHPTTDSILSGNPRMSLFATLLHLALPPFCIPLRPSVSWSLSPGRVLISLYSSIEYRLVNITIVAVIENRYKYI